MPFLIVLLFNIAFNLSVPHNHPAVRMRHFILVEERQPLTVLKLFSYHSIFHWLSSRVVAGNIMTVLVLALCSCTWTSGNNWFEVFTVAFPLVVLYHWILFLWKLFNSTPSWLNYSLYSDDVCWFWCPTSSASCSCSVHVQMWTLSGLLETGNSFRMMAQLTYITDKACGLCMSCLIYFCTWLISYSRLRSVECLYCHLYWSSVHLLGSSGKDYWTLDMWYADLI